VRKFLRWFKIYIFFFPSNTKYYKRSIEPSLSEHSHLFLMKTLKKQHKEAAALNFNSFIHSSHKFAPRNKTKQKLYSAHGLLLVW
jgi:hypothetical protein